MKSAGRFTIVILLISIAVLACGSSTATGPTQPSGDTGVTATRAPTRVPSPTPEQLQLEFGQFQVFSDRQGNVRVNVLMHNPYDFPVEFSFRPRASLLNSAGELVRDDELLLLDGIGGRGLILPGETIAAYGCFTCERAPLPEAWESVRFIAIPEDATGSWNYSTEAEASAVDVSFDDPFVYVSGTVKNNSPSALSRVSIRVFVYDSDGILVGVGEASAYDVGPGASASADGYGFGVVPDGAYHFEFTVVGVTY